LDDEDPETTTTVFENDMQTALLEERLQDELDTVNADSPVYILTGLKDGDRVIGGPELPGGDERSLSGGAIGGIVVGGVVGLIAMALLLSRGRRDQSELYLKQNESVDVEELHAVDKTSSKNQLSRAVENPSQGLAASSSAGLAASLPMLVLLVGRQGRECHL